jgi:hypothetical protein
MGGPIEQHVLEKVSDPLLSIRLIQTAGTDVKVNADPVFRTTVLHEDVPKAVG